MKKLYPIEITLLLTVALLLASGVSALHTQEELSEKVVRLHVLANSDSEEDQALKLLVRDAVLETTTKRLAGVADRGEAAQRLYEILPELQCMAEQVIQSQGYAYPVRTEVAPVDFPTKTYDGFSLPAGEYLALRVLIGEAAGQNWWCVVFPPLCTAVTADVPLAALSAGLTEEQVALITEESPQYVLKFKSVELWERIRVAIS